MSASLVGSEMCIRDRVLWLFGPRTGRLWLLAAARRLSSATTRLARYSLYVEPLYSRTDVALSLIHI
eukprot:11769267-Alexandrium_andersonii.AAC.1